MNRFGNRIFALGLFVALSAFAPVAGYGQKSSPSPSNVNVVNTPSVRDADHPARQPFQSEISLVGVPGTFGLHNIGHVPAGKRLVIENISVSGVTPTGQRMFIGLITAQGNFIARHPLLVHTQGVNETGEAEFVVSQQVRLYADPETDVTLWVRRSSPTGGGLISYATISGYLVDVQ